MPTATHAITISCMLLTILALGGCGSGSSAGDASASLGQAMVLQSPAVTGGKHATLPSRYTCDGQDVSLPLVWGEVPAGTSERMRSSSVSRCAKLSEKESVVSRSQPNKPPMKKRMDNSVRTAGSGR